jgi:hypothetical protein
MLLLGIIEKYGEKTQSNLYYTWNEWHTDTFSPATKIKNMILFKISGKTYAEKQENLRQLAIDFQLSNATGLSWGEYAEIENFFEKNAKKYGLLKEFKENGII